MMSERVRRAVAAVRRRIRVVPRVGAILGSGLGEVVDAPRDRADIPYDRIPHWPRSAVHGHAGVLTVGRLGRTPLALMKGRSHYYEGWAPHEVGFPVRVLAGLGVKVLVVTSATGGVNPKFQPGDIVAVTDHINLMGMNPLRGEAEPELGPRFVEMGTAYDPKLREVARKVARRHRVRLREGVYAAMSGPTYETPAEVRMVRALGGDLVGMSTAPEVIVARQMGLRVLALSLVTNRAAGLSRVPVSHEEVIETAARAKGRMGALLGDILAVAGEGA